MTALRPLANELELQLFEARLPSGLSLRVDERKERRTGFLALGVDFGSIDRVGPDGRPIPAGTAHFLEHELFEDEAGDVSDRFAALGASSNAMTGFSGTTYVAATNGDVLPAAALLLAMVQAPTWEAARVDRERQVIAQEIRMYEDDADWRVFEGLLRCLYARHPVRDSIAGSEADIATIDAPLLAAVHGACYRPQDLCLCVSGPVDARELLELALRDQGRRAQETTGPGRRPRDDAGEAPVVAAPRRELRLPVERPRLLLGFKEHVLGGAPRVIAARQLATRMLLDLLLGPSSAAHEALYAEGLIDESFGVSHSAEPGFGFTAIGGETDDPAALERRLREILLGPGRAGLDAAAHARIAHKLYGSLMRALDEPETVAFGLLSSCFRQLSPFCALELVGRVGLPDLARRAEEHLREERLACCVVLPA